MKIKAGILITFILLMFTVKSHASGKTTEHKANIFIPDVALLTIEPVENSKNDIIFERPGSSGVRIQFSQKSKSETRINYSSVIHKNQYRRITATIVEEIPEGLIMKLNASGCQGKGTGELGIGHQAVILSNTPADAISGIGSAFTGKGNGTGHIISYELDMSNPDYYDLYNDKQYSFTVMFTLTDDN